MKNKQDLLFLVIGISLFFALAFAAFYSISFLIIKIQRALKVDVINNNRLVKINLESLKNIQITETAKEAESAAEMMEGAVNGAVE